MHAGVTFKSRPFYFNNMQAFPVFILAWLIFFFLPFLFCPTDFPSFTNWNVVTQFKFVFLIESLVERNLTFRATLQTNQYYFFIIKCQYVQGFLIVDEFQTRKSKFVATDISLDEKSRALLPSIYTFVIRHKDATRSYNNNRNSWFKIALRPLSRL